MRILLVRHGESEGNVDEEAYTVKGDEGVALTDRGWRQGIGSGRFLKSIYEGQDEWPTLYFSPYRRTQETLSAMLHGMGDVIPGKQPVLRGDSRLIEKSFGATNILNHPPDSVDRQFAEQQKQTLKVYPILDWSDREVAAYFCENKLPKHPLEAEGYATMGDWHSTNPLAEGQSAETSRFGGKKYECGLHLKSETQDFQI